jgi:hypothetical protein
VKQTLIQDPLTPLHVVLTTVLDLLPTATGPMVVVGYNSETFYIKDNTLGSVTSPPEYVDATEKEVTRGYPHLEMLHTMRSVARVVPKDVNIGGSLGHRSVIQINHSPSMGVSTMRD